MSNYSNFVSDFPERCAELLGQFEKLAQLRRREVTLMLCIATPSIVVPLERLAGPRSKPEGEQPGHPSRDWEKFVQAKSDLDRLFILPFKGSRLWPDVSASSWSFGKLSDVSGEPDSWGELSAPKRLGPDKKAKAVLLHMRHALAHGNIFTRGRPEIEQIILLSQRAPNVNKFNFLAVAPADFRIFLQNWMEFLRDLKLPVDVVSMSAETAA
jgi:hypothetical protein